MSTRSQSSRRAVAGAASLLALAAGLSGCAGVGEKFADAWAVTYELTVSGGGGLTDVVYAEAPERGKDSQDVTAGAVDAASQPWEVVAQVTATQPARVSATPDEGSTASCRVLLDGVEEIVARTGEPGERVMCEARTPTFKEQRESRSPSPTE